MFNFFNTNSKNNLSIENFWITVVWAMLFMLVLAWDQEKIVLLNLILFCYFLKYLLGDSIEETFEQRKLVITSVLTQDIDNRLNSLVLLLDQANNIVSNVNHVILTIVKKSLASFNSLFALNKNASLSIDKNFNFISINAFLVSFCNSAIRNTNTEFNLFVLESADLNQAEFNTVFEAVQEK